MLVGCINIKGLLLRGRYGIVVMAITLRTIFMDMLTFV
jgi:hypothetical protein